MTVRHYELVT